MADNNAAEFQEEEFTDTFGQPQGSPSKQAEVNEQDFFGPDHGNEPGHGGDNVVHEDFGETGGYQAHEGGFDSGFVGGHEQGQVQQQYQGGNMGGDGYDDFFGAPAGNQGGPSGGQLGSPQQPYGMAQVISPGLGKSGGMGGMGGYDQEYDPEEEERLERLRRIEQERNQRLDQKAREERERKQEKIADAAKELARWHSEREQNNEKRRQINKQNQDIKNETDAQEDYKNSWDKIVGNIALKEGEYPGTKDVTRFRQSLINKKADEAKGVNTQLADF